MSVPIVFHEHYKLTNAEVHPAFIALANVSLNGDKHVTVREQFTDKTNVVVIDIQSSKVLRYPVQAEAASMHPTKCIVALQAGKVMQIVDLANKRNLKTYNCTENLLWWKWLDEKILVLICEASVFHWTYDDDSVPVKIFDRLQQLPKLQYLKYCSSPDYHWMAFTGIVAENGSIVGKIQLYNSDRKVSQQIDGSAICFATFQMPGNSKPTTLFCFAQRIEEKIKVNVIEISKPEENKPFGKKIVEIAVNREDLTDFAVVLQASSKYGVLYLITKCGFIHIIDIETAVCFFSHRVTVDTVFLGCDYAKVGGVLFVTKSGQILSVSIDEKTVTKYIVDNCKNSDLALRFANQFNCSGSDELVQRKFNSLLEAGSNQEAAIFAARSPRGILRTSATITRLQQIPVVQGQTAPLLNYFSELLNTGSLNKEETVQLLRIVVSQNRKDMVQKWMKDKKLESSEEAGDILRPLDVSLALVMYIASKSSPQVVECLAELGKFSAIAIYCKQNSYEADYISLLRQILRTHPEASVEFMNSLCAENPPLIDVNSAIDCFLEVSAVKYCTAFLLEYLKDDKESDSSIQTRLLEMNLLSAPAVADAILGNDMFHHYDRNAIGQLCEKVGLFQRALEHFSDIYDIKRTIAHPQMLKPEWLINFFGSLSVDNSMECLKAMLEANLRQNLHVVVQICSRYHAQLQVGPLIKLFESFKAFDGLFLFLGLIVNVTTDPEAHFKYIEAATKVGQLKEVERVCRDSQYYDAERVKNFLKDAKLADQMALIIVCDRHNMIKDLVSYLYRNQQYRYIEILVQKVNPARLPVVLGALLDANCPEDIIKQLLLNVPKKFSMQELVEEIEQRNSLKLLCAWFEKCVVEGDENAATHNALAKIYVDSRRDAERFLRENKFYDSATIGKYCEKRDPHLAFLAYERGQCDDELLRMCNENALYKNLARYVVNRVDANLWVKVLDEQNVYRRSLIDQVVQAALPETNNPEAINITVKAFLAADLPNELLEVLEKIVLEGSAFSDHSNLQNLLVIIGLQAKSPRVMTYVKKLSNYNAPKLAELAISKEAFEEAFAIYNRFDVHTSAISVLIDNISSLERASQYADTVDKPEVWSILAKAQLRHSLCKEAIQSFIKADDSTCFEEVIRVCSKCEKWTELVQFLQMARSHTHSGTIESDLIYALAKTGNVDDLDDILATSSSTQLTIAGNRCYKDGLYEAAKKVFLSISDFAQLAATQIQLKEYATALESARKANSTKIWKTICFACVDAQNFNYAQIAGHAIIVHADELSEVTRYYEEYGYFEELISLLETGLTLERAHMGMFTELSILYSKYKPDKLQEHLDLFWSRLNIPQVLRAVELAHMWSELTFLYDKYEEYDNAITVMIKHPTIAWRDGYFKEIIVKTNSVLTCYSAITFYLNFKPMLLNDLLLVVSSRVDHSHVIDMLSDNAKLIRPYLRHVQKCDNQEINTTLNNMYVEEEDVDALCASIEAYPNFDKLALARRLQAHELLAFRRVAVQLYNALGRWEEGIDMCKRDELYNTAMELAAESKNAAIVDDLLSYFVARKLFEHFAVMLYVCYDFLHPGKVMMLAWTNNISEFVMPFLTQKMFEYEDRLSSLEQKLVETRKHDEEQRAIERACTSQAPLMLTYGSALQLPMLSAPLTPRSRCLQGPGLG